MSNKYEGRKKQVSSKVLNIRLKKSWFCSSRILRKHLFGADSSRKATSSVEPILYSLSLLNFKGAMQWAPCSGMTSFIIFCAIDKVPKALEAPLLLQICQGQLNRPSLGYPIFISSSLPFVFKHSFTLISHNEQDTYIAQLC